MSPSATPGLYLHLPFCSAICPYCDFSVLIGTEERRARFVELLVDEIALGGPAGWPAFVEAPAAEPFDTVYLGGGTPSLLAGDQLARILAAARRLLPISADAEISLEANPEDVTPASLADWRALGVHTLSLGVQSFDDDGLQMLGRRHGPQQGRRAVELAQAAGFPTVSVDLIYGLPGQTEAAWRSDLEAATALQPDHLSCYQLTIHERTPFGFRRARGSLRELRAEVQADLFFLTHRLLEDAGYRGYEVSNFARGRRSVSRHNRKYWDHTPYLGLGPSAHSFCGRHRWWNVRKIKPWEASLADGRPPLDSLERLGSGQLALERIALGLRTRAGVDFARLPVVDPEAVWRRHRPLIDQLVAAGLVRLDQRRLLPTLTGMAVADSLAARFDPGPLEAADGESTC